MPKKTSGYLLGCCSSWGCTLTLSFQKLSFMVFKPNQTGNVFRSGEEYFRNRNMLSIRILFFYILGTGNEHFRKRTSSGTFIILTIQKHVAINILRARSQRARSRRRRREIKRPKVSKSDPRNV